MKNPISIILLVILTTIFYTNSNAQYDQGHSAIELNELTKVGLSLKNSTTNPFHGSIFRIYSDQNQRFDIGVRSSAHIAGNNQPYLQTWNDASIDFYIGSKKRMNLGTNGLHVIGDLNSTDTVAHVEVTYQGLSDIVAFAATSIPDGIGNIWGIAGDFRGGFIGVQGRADVGTGVVGGSVSGTGVSGFATIGKGVFGTSTDTSGVEGWSDKSYGVVGVSSAFSATPKAGVFGYANGTNSYGVHGHASSQIGVYGSSDSSQGVYGSSTSNVGVQGSSGSGNGVEGSSASFSKAGVRGNGSFHGVHGDGSTSGVYGRSLFKYGVEGHSLANPGSGFDFYASGPAPDWGTSSSRRWKNNIQNIENPLEKIINLRGVTFDWDEEHGGGRHDIGFIAEEVGEVIPMIVSYEDNGVDAIGMDYTKIGPLLVEAFNSLKTQYDKILADQSAEIQNLKKEIMAIKTLNNRSAGQP